MLAQTFSSMKKTRPRIVQEFVEKLALLQKEKPLEAPVTRHHHPDPR